MKKRRIGFISFRISGTDGVSLETKKWASVFEEMGHESFFMAGQLDTDPERSFLVEEAHFHHPEIIKLYEQCFSNRKRPQELSTGLHHYREILKTKLRQFIDRFDLDLIIPQNTLTIPLNISLGMAITEVIAETGIPTIAHHHDFFWERKRFLTNCVWDYLNSCYPPHLPMIQHVVINSSGQNQLALRTGISSHLIPNVMDFEHPPTEPLDDFNKDVRKIFGIDDDELFVLQPTRVVQRKGIEHAIELVARMHRKAVLVISHASGDEGYEYQNRVHKYAELLGIRAIFVDHQIGDKREISPSGEKTYTLQDVYPHADLVTYPSLQEGFGNAFLETIYFRKPILVNNYSIYRHDIKPKGFDVIEMDDFITDKTVDYTERILSDPERLHKMVETNYALGLKYYSYAILRTTFRNLLSGFFGEEEAREHTGTNGCT
ncbi:glycosyltransferase family 4 protein [Sediminispirochaeta bajacaliforniensis]|uniref:glycosyltransferase family 4 protein n=1 Tax=Sediminispirochaeta bajacaliforniensis TaxID=148 RepID=UPI0003610EB7|nr:glycosyltransferase family 4 protein [Sediminispirochaeta bajacaliforniensis]